MDPPQRILVAMSGGVDSSVAAARLVAAGHDVVGVTLHLWDYPDDGQVKGRCCAPEDVHDARRVCETLGIPHEPRRLAEQRGVNPEELECDMRQAVEEIHLLYPTYFEEADDGTEVRV